MTRQGVSQGRVSESVAFHALQIPSYFALILRAFSVIEGIALRVDPDYSIVQVSQRLISFLFLLNHMYRSDLP